MAVSIYERLEKAGGGPGVPLAKGPLTPTRRLDVEIDRIDPERPLVRYLGNDWGWDSTIRARNKTRFDLDLSDPTMGVGQIVRVSIKVTERHVSFIPDDAAGVRYAVSGADAKTMNIIKSCELIQNGGKFDEVVIYCGKTAGFTDWVSFNLGFIVRDLEEPQFQIPIIYDPDVKNDG